MKYVYDKAGNLISAFDQDNEELIKRQLGEDIFITDEDLGSKAIVEGDIIRAETRIDRVLSGREDLFHGEYIEDNEIKYVEKLSNYHSWDSGTNKWVYDKTLELNFINSEILNKETELNNLYDTLDKATARRLKALIADTQHKIDKIIEELETLENRSKELEG